MTPRIDLYVVVDRGVFDNDEGWLAALEELSAVDVPRLALQVRAKNLPPEDFEALAMAARKATADARVPVLLNGDTGTAHRLGFAGVHWPAASISAEAETQAERIGASVHSPAAARCAERAGAHFLVAGTIFDAGSKSVPGRGLALLRAIADATSLPVLAIGGITPDNTGFCVRAGAQGVAVVTNVLYAPDMTAAIRALREALDAAAIAERSR